ncbi:hypothetical protein ANCDUO_20399 [Ancylostoma duodenale]|uniref:Unspecific monooxygenase n=1 Tax=Ancylostoma duodenale TaxID=51022 RepID=A0A0C2FLQ5_9BILA|nr:hypothetical protein ANCDUO_20399 [Ancylostoma duodenale]
MSLLDLWGAAQETTTTTLYWAFSYLLLHPKVKSRVEEELISITKGQRPLIITDCPNTPYYKATLNFNPDRYFSGDRVEQMVVPFGLGKRACPGESLAQAELYLIIGNLLLRYEVTGDPEHMPSMRARKQLGTTRMAQPYHIHFKRRQ